MKLITFSREGITQRVGAIINEEVIDLHVAYKSLLASEGKKFVLNKSRMHLFLQI
ncbi:hypothetical protein GCM10020331_000470 [Ectobacillus funiculus]